MAMFQNNPRRFVQMDTNGQPSRHTMSMNKPYTPVVPHGFMEAALVRRSAFRSDAEPLQVKHWSEYGPGEIVDPYVARGLGNPPNLSYVQPYADESKQQYAQEKRLAQSIVDNQPYVIRSIRPLATPQTPAALSPLDQSLYEFPVAKETHARNHGPLKRSRVETLVDDDDDAHANAGSDSLLVISKDQAIRGLSAICVLLILYIAYLLSR